MSGFIRVNSTGSLYTNILGSHRLSWFTKGYYGIREINNVVSLIRMPRGGQFSRASVAVRGGSSSVGS